MEPTREVYSRTRAHRELQTGLSLGEGLSTSRTRDMGAQGCVIHKLRLREQYVQPENPYSLALKYCLERTYEFLRDCGQHQLETPFLFECRGRREDSELELVFRRLCDGESRWGRMPGFSIEFFDKKANLPGLQIADLVSMPIGQHVVRPERRNRAFEMIQQKFCGLPDDDASAWGMKVFP
jgi:Protein of unknown function (DUF3800)